MTTMTRIKQTTMKAKEVPNIIDKLAELLIITGEIEKNQNEEEKD